MNPLSDGFVTQLEGDLPRLLVISLQLDQVWLSALLKKTALFGLQGEVFSVQQKGENTLPTAAGDAYKAVIVFPIDEIEQLHNFIKANAVVLRSVSRVAIVLYGAQWQVVANFSLWEKLNALISDQLPKASTVTIVDCLKADKKSPLLEQWEEVLTRTEAHTNNTELVDTTNTIYLLSEETLLRRIEELLFRPLPAGWFVVRGEAISSTEVVTLLSEGIGRLGAQPPHIHASPTPPLDFAQLGNILIEGKDSSASLGINAALQEEVTRFLTNLDRLPFSEPAKEIPSTLPLPTPPKKPLVPEEHIPPRPLPQPEFHKTEDTLPKKNEPVVSQNTQPFQTSPTPQISQKPQVLQTPQTPLKTEVNVDKALNELFATERSEEKNTHVKETAKYTKTVVHKLKRRKRVYWGGLILLGITLAFLFAGGVYVSTYALVEKNLQDTVKLISEKKLSSDVTKATPKSNLVTDALSWQATTYSAVFSLSTFDDALRMATLSKLTTEVPTKLVTWKKEVGGWLSKAVSGETAPTLEELSTLSSTEEQLYADVSSLTAGLKTIEDSELSPEQSESFKTFDKELLLVRKQLVAFQQLQPLFAQLFGYQQPRTYAIIFQNPQELRPTGGFLQSVALVTFNKGLLTDTQVISSYDLDKNLLGSVQPPADLQRFLGEQRWFLRDANWSGHYPTAATNISWFVEQTARKPVDGVIAVDAYTWQAIIKVLGPLEVPEYNEVITDKNLLERLEFHSELIFDQGQPKTEYSTLIFTKLLSRIKQASPEQMSQIVDALGEKTVSSNMLVWLKQPSEAAVMANLGVDGGMLSPSCPDQFNTESCAVDTVAQIEANVGVNKANAHLEKSTTHSITLQNNQASHTRTTTYRNTAVTPAWPKGPYKAYVRWYLSPTSNNVAVFNGKNRIPTDQLIFTEEAGKQVVGAFIEIPVQQTAQLSITYNSPLSYQGEFSYALFSQRQPGLEENSETVIITHDPSFKPQLIIPQATVSGASITFNNGVHQGHTFVGVSFK